MKPEAIIESVAIAIYFAAGLRFFYCLGAAIVTRRYSARTMLVATTAACIMLAMLFR
jgi:hypothetical protein